MGKTVAEKIFEAHRVDNPADDVHVIRLDAVFCHEITTPTAIKDLERRGKDRIFDPRKIKAVIDHVSPAKDSKTATQGRILREWARRHGIKDFYDIGRHYRPRNQRTGEDHRRCNDDQYCAKQPRRTACVTRFHNDPPFGLIRY